MNTEVYDLLKKYGAVLASQGYSVGKEARLFLQTDEGIFATRLGAHLEQLESEDIEKIDGNQMPFLEAENKAAVISQTPYCQRCLNEGKAFNAVLDDMAQIIGPKAEIMDASKSDPASDRRIKKILKKSAGCFIKTKPGSENYNSGITLTVGRNLFEAVTALTVLEKSAEIFLKASVLGGGKELSRLDANIMHFVYKKKYSKKEQEVKSEEGKKKTNQPVASEPSSVKDYEYLQRLKLVEYGKKLVSCGLVQGTWGNISVRLDDDYMLATPSGLDYTRLTPADMVKVCINSLEYEGALKPTSEKGLHAAIYSGRPDVGAVIHTHSKYCSIFAAAQKEMPITSEEAQKTFGNSLPLASYGLPGTKKLMKNTAYAIGQNFGCIMANHGMAACGSNLETAFENCCVLEELGMQYIDSRFR